MRTKKQTTDRAIQHHETLKRAINNLKEETFQYERTHEIKHLHNIQNIALLIKQEAILLLSIRN